MSDDVAGKEEMRFSFNYLLSYITALFHWPKLLSNWMSASILSLWQVSLKGNKTQPGRIFTKILSLRDLDSKIAYLKFYLNQTNLGR